MGERYTGPICFQGNDHYVKRPWWLGGGMKLLWEKGWHYSTRIDRNGNEVPDRKLHLNDSDPNEANWFYEFAQPHHESWLVKHGSGNVRELELTG